MEKSEIIEMLENYRELELMNIKKCQEKEEKLTSPSAKLMVYQIRIDSTKHAHILQTLIDMIKADTPESEYYWDFIKDRYVGKLVAEKAIQEHIEIEKEMVKSCKELLKKVDNPGLEAMLRFMFEDEKMHSKLLEDVAEKISKLGPQL